MSLPPTDVRLADLLAERSWVRSLARSLVRDEALADDLEQETWLAALERPPTWHTSPRGWLARVLRNRLARTGRSGARGARRERAAARPEALPATDEVLAQAEQHRRVVDALWALDEVHRTAVLLRYYEGLPPRAIAVRTGAPVETVRARVRRGVEQMRARLDAEQGGERRAWVLALAPLLEGHGGLGLAPAAAGGALVTTKTWIAAGVLLLLLGGGAAWWLQRTPPSTGPAAGGPTSTRAASPEEAARGPLLAGREGARAPSPADAAPEPAAPRVPPPQRRGVRALRKGTQQPPAGPVTVATGGLGAARTLYAARAPAADGWVPLDGVPGVERVPILWAQAPGMRLARLTDVEIASGTTVIELEPAAPQRLEFLDEAGRALPAADVRARFEAAGVTPSAEWLWPEAVAPSTPADILRSVVGGAEGWRIGSSALAWTEASASVGDGLPVPGARLLVQRPSGAPWLSPPLAEGDVVRVPLASRRLLLRVLDAGSGQPLSGAQVTPFAEHGDDALFLRGAARSADARGEVALDVPAEEPGRRAPSLLIEAWAQADRAQGGSPSHALWMVQALGARIARGAGGAAGAQDLGTVEVRVRRTATLVGRAYRPDGEPAVNYQVVWLERGLVRSTLVGLGGAFRLEGVAPWRQGGEAAAARTVSAMLVDPATGVPGASGSATVRPGETAEVQVGRPPGPSDRCDLRGRVTAGGQPFAGVLLLARRQGASDDSQRNVATSGADGAFELRALEPGTYDVLALLGNLRVSDDYVLRRAQPLVLEAGHEARTDLALPAGRLRVRVVDDASGAALAGAMVAAHPERKEASQGAVEGFAGQVGGSAFADAEGRALLAPLLPGEPHVVMAVAEGYREVRRTAVLPAAGDGGPEVELRLVKR